MSFRPSFALQDLEEWREGKNREVDIPYTWGDFVEQRGEGPRADDLRFPADRVPDVVFFSPGYHASMLKSTAYGDMTERILAGWRDALRERHYGAPRRWRGWCR